MGCQAQYRSIYNYHALLPGDSGYNTGLMIYVKRMSHKVINEFTLNHNESFLFVMYAFWNPSQTIPIIVWQNEGSNSKVRNFYLT